MEIASLVIGAVGLTGILSSYKELMDLIDGYTMHGVESEQIKLQVAIERHRLGRWAGSVGIQDGRLKMDHNSTMDDPETADKIIRTLAAITELFAQAPKTDQGQANSYALMDTLHRWDTIVVDSNKVELLPRAKVSKFEKLRWALRGKSKSINNMAVFTQAVNNLHELVPLNSSQLESDKTLAQLERRYKDFEAQLSKEVLRWLNASEPNQDFENNVEARIENTCDWIFKESEFMEWLSPEVSPDHSKILWLYGPAGFGKSVLCAHIISQLQKELRTPLAFFFCSSETTEKRDPMTALRSWIMQIINWDNSVLELARTFKDNTRRNLATRNDIWEAFQHIIHRVPDCILVLDGFDECKPDSSRSETGISRTFLREVREKIVNSSTRLLIISRDEVDIRYQLNSSHSVSGETIFRRAILKDDVEADIHLYSKAAVNEKLPRKDEIARLSLAEDMAKKSDGMFLYIKLLKDRLRGGYTLRQLRQVVTDMPAGLDQAYQRNLDHIKGLQYREKERVINILRWTLFAAKPLSVSEIAEALVVADDDETDTISDEDLPDELDTEYVDDVLLEHCSALVEIRTPSGSQDLPMQMIHIAHSSVKEYLTSPKVLSDLFERPKLLLWPHDLNRSYMARTCLRYLNYTNVWEAESRVGNVKCAVRKFNHRHFLEHALQFWHVYYDQEAADGEGFSGLADKFFALDNQHWDHWRNGYEEDELQDAPEMRERQSGTRIYYAAMFGLTSTLCILYDQGQDVDTKCGYFGSALQAAVVQQQRKAIDYLLEILAAVRNHGGFYGSPLGAASAVGDLQTVQLLLRKRSALIPTAADGQNPTSLAVRDECKLLAQIGIAVDEKGLTVWTPRNTSSEDRDVEVAHSMFNIGADVTATDTDGWTPLHWASGEGHVGVVALLLENGADTSAVDTDGWTPLYIASREGHVEVVKLLLERDADHSVMDTDGLTSLNKASAKGYSGVVHALLEKGADLTVVNKKGSTPLNNAANKGFIKVVQMLLDRDANPTTADKKGRTPLTRASSKGHIEIVKLLLKNGVDPTITDKKGRTPLSKASSEGHIEVVEALLEEGIDPTVTDMKGRTPLSRASMKGHLEVVKVLLAKGVDPILADKKGRTPLSEAVDRGHLAVVKLLLGKVADPTVEDEHGRPLFNRAVRGGDMEIVEVMLENWPDLNVVGEAGWTLLDRASGDGHVEVVRYLLEHGADPTLRAEEGRTPLDRAVSYGRVEVVELLRERRADIGE